jgi:hypothetical protein
MSYSSEQTRERILSCARREFLENGFEKANLRRIADAARATTGALYAHFKNKEGLFDALVCLPAEQLFTRYEEMHNQVEVSPYEDVLAQTEKISSDGMDWMLEFIYEHFDAFKLIICCSEGTAYSGYVDKLIEIEESTTRRILPVETVKAAGDFFIHVACSSGVREFFEMVAHDLPKKEAVRYIEKIKQFHSSGWREIFSCVNSDTS